MAEWCQQHGSLKRSLRPSLFALQPAEHPQLKDASAQHTREFHTCDCKRGGLEHTEEGKQKPLHRFLPSWPLAQAAVEGAWEQQERRTWLQPPGGNICSPKQPGGGGSGAWDPVLQQLRVPKSWPLPASPTVADPANLTTLDTAEAPLTLQALLHPHTPPNSHEPVIKEDLGHGKRGPPCKCSSPGHQRHRRAWH